MKYLDPNYLKQMKGVIIKMATTTKTICDVKGCKEDGFEKFDCCWGWTISDGNVDTHKKYKKFEKPLKGQQSDLCLKHWREWSRITCKLLKMDKEIK